MAFARASEKPGTGSSCSNHGWILNDAAPPKRRGRRHPSCASPPSSGLNFPATGQAGVTVQVPERGTHRWPAACVVSTSRRAEESVTAVSTGAVTVSAQAGRGLGPHPGATCATGMRRAGGGFRKLLQMPGRLRGSVGSRPPFTVIYRPLRPVPVSRSFPRRFRARLPPAASVTPRLWAPRPGHHRPPLSHLGSGSHVLGAIVRPRKLSSRWSLLF